MNYLQAREASKTENFPNSADEGRRTQASKAIGCEIPVTRVYYRGRDRRNRRSRFFPALSVKVDLDVKEYMQE